MLKRYAVALLLVISMLAVPAGAEDKVLEPADHAKITSVGSPAVSADGQWVAYSISTYSEELGKRESNIYLQPLAGGEARQLTAMKGSESSYTWHPSEPLLAFSANRGDEKSQIYVIDIRGGEARQITTVDSGAGSPQWSPDGSMIAFYSSVDQRDSEEEDEAFGDVIYARNLRYYHLGPGWDKGKRQRIFVVAAGGGEARQLTDGPCADEGDRSMVWHPDGSKIAFVSNREKEWWNTIDTNIFTVTVADGTLEQISDNRGPDHSPAYSPNGSMLAWRTSFEYNYESENYKIAVKDLSTGEMQTFGASLDRTIRAIQWAESGDAIYFSAADQGYSHVRKLALDDPEAFLEITSGNMQIRSWEVQPDGTVVMLAGTDTQPYEVTTWKDGTAKQLSTAASDWWADYAVSPSEEIWVTTEDGARIQGWLIKPIGYTQGERVPLLLSIHGGPHGMFSPNLSFSYQLMAQQGIAVLYTNPRGSEGYGEAFKKIIREDWNTAPFTDLMASVDAAIDLGVADPDALGVMGGSYGGYMTNWIIGNTDRFKAAVSVAGLSNMVSFYGSTDEQFFAEIEMNGTPWQNREAYLKNSPIWYAENFSTPTMVVHGSDDWRVRPEQGRQLFTALQKMGVPSVWVEFPGEQHGVRGTKHRTLYYRLIGDWFGHWLQGKDPGLATYNPDPTPYEHPVKTLENETH